MTRKRRRRVKRVALMLLAVLVSFGTLEIAVRQVLITETIDGQAIYAHRFWLLPHKLPVLRTEQILEQYFSRSDSSYVMYDPLLGWTLRPLATSDNGQYTTNAAGLRADREYTLDPPGEMVRIAVFGDSFTHGEQVNNGETWPDQLDAMLDEAEVINFGVSGYGIDQAYLRWHHVGRSYQPDIVILGLVDADVFRVVNVMRPLYLYLTGIPFSKPRFVLGDDGELSLINSPAIAPETIVETLRSFPDSPLAPYEYFYKPADFEDHWYLQSRLVAALLTIRERTQIDGLGGLLSPEFDSSEHTHLDALLDPSDEAAQITLAILNTWASEVEAQGGQFIVVHLPRLYELERFRDSDTLAFPALMDAIKARHTVIEDIDRFDALPAGDYYIDGGHYSPTGNQVIAAAVADWLRTNDESFSGGEM
jgi:lysophospholipase L1-like esterase